MFSKYYLACPIIVMLCLTPTFVQGKNFTPFKVAANLGLVNGGTIGFKVDHDDNDLRNSYICINYMYSHFTTYGGINYTVQKLVSDRFYYLWSSGIDVGKIENLSFNMVDSSDPDPEYNVLLSPHITFGLGYDLAKWKNGSMFIEWDIGIKAAITNINIGTTF
jgi:hypothetical protein